MREAPKEYLVIRWHVNEGRGEPDFLFGPTLENLMNGACKRWKDLLPRGFPDFYEAVKESRLSLYKVEQQMLELSTVPKFPPVIKED